MIVVVMGVSGAGITINGEALARRLGWRFIDVDDYHPPENVAKMAAGTPLDDADRWPWLDNLNRILQREKNAVIACSALKEAYRRRLTAGLSYYEIVYLHGTRKLIRSRMKARPHRYMPASLLDSQFAALEPPARAIAIDVAAEPSACVAEIASRLQINDP